MQMPSEGRVVDVDRCDLVVGEKPWAFAREHATAIDAHWARRSAESPQFFNGRVLMLSRFDIEGGVLSGDVFETDFKSFLFWRESGEKPGCGIVDAFGSALIRAGDGAVLLGKQRPGNINSGLSYLPGGFIDRRDICHDGQRRVIDIRASIRREIAEETGLTELDYTEQPGFIVTVLAAQVSIAVTFRCHLPAIELRAKILAHILSEENPELDDVVIVRSADDIKGLPMPPYARTLINTLYGSHSSLPGD
jgi:8-oxo-dGTP pyrophosphatase MutT (NUDIX family)